jgi:hypothetical protein
LVEMSKVLFPALGEDDNVVDVDEGEQPKEGS